MRRDQLVTGEWYAAKAPSSGPDVKPVKVKVIHTKGAYEDDSGIIILSPDQGQGVVVSVDGEWQVIRLQLIRQTWADYEAGKPVEKWKYEPKDTMESYKQLLRRVINHPQVRGHCASACEAELERLES